jgi:hypothetical protein
MLYSALKRVRVRSANGVTVVDMSDVKRREAIEALNLGWQYVAEVEMGLKGYYEDTLVQGVSEYLVPDEVLKVEQVRLLDGSALKVDMVPTVFDGVLAKDATGERAEGTPKACAVGLWKFEDALEAKRCLKFDRPPSWGGDGCIEIYCTRVPEFISDETKTPDLPATLGMAGYWQALVHLTGSAEFERRREESLTAYRRLGIGNEAYAMKSRYGR